MMPAPRAFVSSTFLDLREHRAHAIRALRQCGFVVDPMEDWPADAREPQTLSVDRLNADLGVLLVARSRGYIPAGSEQSITQQEYQFAVDHGMDMLVFMLDDEAPWHRRFDELGSDPGITAWREYLQTAHTCARFGLEPSSLDVTTAAARWLQQREAVPREVEYKLTSLANAQFKFHTLETATQVLNKLRVLSELVGAKCEFGSTELVVDEYFDDAGGSLERGHCSLRIRTESRRSMITCKARRDVSTSGALERYEEEKEVSAEDVARLRESGFREPLQGTFRDRFGVFIDPGVLTSVLTVTNQRTSARIQTPFGGYRFNYDKYYFRHGDHYSEYFVELELEIENQPRQRDTVCDRLLRALSDLLGYQHGAQSAMSKYDRGVQWARGKTRDTVPVHCLGFRILGFADQNATQQKQAIQALNHFLKASFTRLGFDPQPLVYLPMGSGMIVIGEARDHFTLTDMVAVAFNLHETLRAPRDPDASHVDLRVSILLHTGTAFKYSDLQEHLNYAGEAIETVHRLIGAGRDWHVLMTPAAHARLGSGQGIGPFTISSVKVGANLLHNVYDELGPHGNSEPPT